VNNDDNKLFQVAYVHGFVGRSVLCAFRWDDSKTSLIYPLFLSINAF